LFDNFHGEGEGVVSGSGYVTRRTSSPYSLLHPLKNRYYYQMSRLENPFQIQQPIMHQDTTIDMVMIFLITEF
jgi:hypothetical protein